jgi:hypothetical protein
MVSAPPALAVALWERRPEIFVRVGLLEEGGVLTTNRLHFRGGDVGHTAYERESSMVDDIWLIDTAAHPRD